MMRFIDKFVDRIAERVFQKLSGQQGWERFLPPVVLRDTIYMVTENGSIYAMRYNELDHMEQIITVRSWR
jgi:hypothetical protein